MNEFHLEQSMMSTSADGEFWSKKFSTPTGMSEDGSNPAFNDFSNLKIFNAKDNPYESGFSFIFTDFKLCREDILSFKKSGIKERTYAVRDNCGLELVECNHETQLIFYIC